jgi:hypothetical protein
LSSSENPESAFQPPAGASRALVSMQREFLAKQIEEHRAKIAWRSSEAAQKEAERVTAAATIDRALTSRLRPNKSK